MASTSIIDWLSQPGTYAHHPQRVNQIETHISRIFLAGDLVYKLKKPVHYDFLDFSSVEARERACLEELRLNRRLAPKIYLDVVPVYLNPKGTFSWRGPGEIVDWLVAMRCLPTDLTLDKLHERDELTPEHIEQLGQVLTEFYRSLAPLPLSPEQYRQRCLSHVRGNRQELLAVQHHLPRRTVERVHGFQLQLLALRPELFDARIRAGRIVDGHGDLRPEHICFSQPLAIFDCIEFSSEFRTIDITDELAFLAMECDAIGAGWVGTQLLSFYRQQTGDQPEPILLDFYKAYRACVRAKIAALRADQLPNEQQAAAVAAAHAHLRLADNYAAPWQRPLVIVVGGLSGTGKSTLAAAVADSLGAELLRTDVVRRDLFGAEPHSREANTGIYNDAGRRQVYAELFNLASALRGERLSLVLDGTFSSKEALRQARELSGHSGTDFLAVECFCRPAIAQRRIAQRLATGQDASEARPEIHVLQQQTWQPWPSELPQIRVDTEQPLNQQVNQVLAALRQRPPS